jgi:hypothetical protein
MDTHDIETGFSHRFPDGKVRCWNARLQCWVRGGNPSPQPAPREPRIAGGGTPKELAAKALAEGDLELAACYLELAYDD